MNYSEQELKFARPLATQILEDAPFRAWLLKGTRFEDFGAAAIPLGEDQAKLRSKNLKNPYWFNYWCGKDAQCTCRAKEGGIETDILIVLRLDDRHLALHIEVKRSGDRLGRGQAESYPKRAACWKNPESRPRTVYPHQHFLTILVCGRNLEGEPDLAFFDRIVFHDEIQSMISGYPEP